nr:hypothetical protein [Tanacetum cinerariifolium]
MTSCDSIGTLMATKHLDADLSGTPVNQTKYRSKVRALMYLTASRPDIMHASCYCARYQAQPTEKHLTAVKQIFRYLKDTIHMGLWYLKDTSFELTAFSDSDHVGCLDSRKSTSGGMQFLGGDSLLTISPSTYALPLDRFDNKVSLEEELVLQRLQKTLTHNKVLVVKPHFKTPYELFRGRTPALSFMRPFGCYVTILNTLDHLGKFNGKSDEKFFVGYSTNNKAFRVYNSRTRKVEEKLHIKFLENKPLIVDSDGENQDDDGPSTESEIDNQERPNDENNTKDINTVGPSINTTTSNINTASLIVNTVRLSDDFFGADNDMRSLDGVELDISNISTTYPVLATPNLRINIDHSLDNVIGDIRSGVQTRRMIVTTDEQGFISAIYKAKTYEDLHTCLFTCFLSQEEPKRITNALKDPAWVEAINKKDKRGIVIRNKDRLVAQGCTQKESIDYDEVFAPVARIEAIRLFLAYASFIGFLIYQMDVKSAFLYGRIKEEKSDRIFISQDKYVHEILRKFKYEDVKPASTPMDKEKALLKDSDGDDVDVDVHLYWSMIGSLMYLAKFLKRIFRYLKGHPKLSLWYSRDSSFDLVAYTDSDYAGASLDRKSTSGGCQFLGFKLISWQCKKQTMVATSTTEAEYVTAASCCGQKPQGSEDFHQIVDFLKASHIRYALIENPTILVSLINQFLRTASVRTLDNGEIELNAIVDGHDKNITEAYVRKHLKLADADGLSTLPTSAKFKQLALMVKTRTRTGRMDIRIPQSFVPSSAADEAITEEMHDGLERATTTTSSLEAEQCSGNTSRNGEDSIQPLELMVLFTKLSNNVTHLKNKLTRTKAIYNKAFITLIKRVKKLEKKHKNKRRMAVIDSSSKEEASLDHKDSPKQGRMIEEIDKDENVNLVKRNKGKAIMQESESPKKIKKKEIMQISLDDEITQRFYEEEQAQILKDEEYAQQVKEEIAQQEDVVAKQAEKERSKKAGGRLKRKISKAREDKDKRKKKQDDLEKHTLMEYVEVIFDSEEVINVIPIAIKSPIVNWKSY